MSRSLIFLALLGLGLATASVLAQDTPGTGDTSTRAGKDPQRQVKHLSRVLELTPQQAATLSPILAQRQQQLAQLRADTSLDRRTRRQRMRSIQQGTDAQIKGVLSDSQMQKYEQWKQEMRQRRQQQRPAGGDDAAQ